MCLWMWTVLKMCSPKHSSFVCRLNGYRAQHSHHFRRPPTAHRPLRPVVPLEAHSGQTASREKPPEAKRRCTKRHSKAASRLRSCCWAKAPRWTPRRTAARASIREACARHWVSPTWGASKKSWDRMITSSMLVNDHNAICHIDINFVYIYIYRHRFVEGNLSETRCIETCWVCLQLFVNICCV